MQAAMMGVAPENEVHLTCLQPGDRIVVVAPSGFPRDLNQLAEGIALLRDRGYEVVNTVPRIRPDHYLAAPDVQRLGALTDALLADDVQAVWAARGGYGATRLLADLPWSELMRARPRWVLGFSDLTGLLLPLLARVPHWGLVHGPHVGGLGSLTTEDRMALWALLEQGRRSTCTGLRVIVPGRAVGPLVGGNLSLVTHLVGTAHLPCWRDAILLLEDLDERPYRLDRMVTQLHLAGLLDDLAGVVLGEFLRCDDPELSLRGEQLLAERLTELLVGKPLLAGLPVGHGTRNLPMLLGKQVELDGARGVLQACSPAPTSNSRASLPSEPRP